MKELENENLKNEIEKLDKMNSEGFSGFSKALQAEVLDIKNRKFKEYMIDVLENEMDDDRSVILTELSKKNKMFKLFKADSLLLILGSENGNSLSFRKYLYTQTDLTTIEIAVIINESIVAFDKEVISKKWKKNKKTQRMDYPLLRAILFSGGKKEQTEFPKIDDPEEIRKPFRSLINQIMKEIELRISRTAVVNTNETENYFTLSKTIEKLMALSIEANGDVTNVNRERIRIEDEKNRLRSEELRLSRLGGTIMSIKAFSETNSVTAEEVFMLTKNVLYPLIQSENISIADEETKKIAIAISKEVNNESN